MSSRAGPSQTPCGPSRTPQLVSDLRDHHDNRGGYDMVARALLIAVLSLVIELISPASSQAQSTITVVDSEIGGPGPGDMVFSVRRNVRYVIHMAFDSGEAVTHRVERDGSLTPVGRSAVGPEPRAIALAHNGDLAIIANSIANELAVFEVGDDGLLREIDRVPSGGLNPYDVAVGYNDVVLVANRDSNQINTFHVDRRGRLFAVDNEPTGLSPHVLVASRNGQVAVANQVGRDMTVFSVNRRGELTPIGEVPLDNMTPRTLAWRGRNLFVALDAPTPSEDLIRHYRVARNGQIEYRGDTPAGAFLTDLEANEDGLFAVTVNVNGPGGQDDRNEVRAYRRDGTALILDASVQTPGFPSFKQVAVGRKRGDVTPVFVTEYQGGFVRSLEYDPVD
jgi:hypothetical protein